MNGIAEGKHVAILHGTMSVDSATGLDSNLENTVIPSIFYSYL